MRRAWAAASLLAILAAVFAQDVRVAGQASRTKFRKPLPRLSPYALAEPAGASFLRQLGLTAFVARPAPLFNLLAGQRNADFTRVVGGGVRMEAAPRLALFLEFRYFSGLVSLARAALPHADFMGLRIQPTALAAGFRFLLSADGR